MGPGHSDLLHFIRSGDAEYRECVLKSRSRDREQVHPRTAGWRVTHPRLNTLTMGPWMPRQDALNILTGEFNSPLRETIDEVFALIDECIVLLDAMPTSEYNR